MYIRMRQGLFFALSDIIDAFVVPGKNTREHKLCIIRYALCVITSALKY